MTHFRSILDIPAEEWLEAMQLSLDDIPDVVIVEGSWWRAQRSAWRLGYLEDVRELAFPDIFWGRWRDKKVAFCMAYLFGKVGAKLAIQIGTCGGLQSHLRSGDIILPETAVCRDGVSHLFGDAEAAFATQHWVAQGERALQALNHTTYRGAHITFASLFAETAVMMTAWHQAGFLSVDMETATTFSISESLDMPALSMLVVWDDLTRGKRFLDPLTDTEQANLNRANQHVYEVALALAEQL